MREISLNASMRSNLLSLQQTQMLQDMTQLRLSTGLKVNSAIDNPSSYYTASSLNNRAKDLSQLLDAMGQGIQTIKTASETLMTATKFLEQAKAVATKASEASFEIVAKVRNEKELLDAIDNGGPGYIVITSDISLTNEIKFKDGQKLVGDNYFAEYNGVNRKLSFDIHPEAVVGIEMANNSLVSNLDIEYQTADKKVTQTVIQAEDVTNAKISNINLTVLDDISGTNVNTFVGIRAKNAQLDITGNVNVDNQYKNFRGYGMSSSNTSTLNILGKLNIKTAANNGYGVIGNINILKEAEVNIQTSGLTAYGLYANTVSLVNIYGKVNISTNKSTAIAIQGGSHINIYKSAQIFIDNSANSISIAKQQPGYEQNRLFIEESAKIAILDSLNPTGVFTQISNGDFFVQSTVSTVIKSDYLKNDPNFDKSIIPWIPLDFTTIKFNEVFSGNEKTKNEKNDSNQYGIILSQYDMLISDSSYKGINLLEGASLKVNFNEERSSQIEVKGVDASAKGLGLQDKTWESKMDILRSVDELNQSINKIRAISSQFGNYYSIVSSRQDFTENLINVLTEGSDKLTLADMNEESANILALKTRQQLAINSLSLASQATQSVLGLF